MSNNGDKRHVVVAGYGPVGRAVVQMLENAGINVTIVELNQRTAETQTRLGKRVVLGDVSDPAVLREAGVETGDALILTIPDEEAAMRACQQARAIAPGIFIAARTNHVSSAFRATQAGADHVTIEEIVTAHSMQEAVMLKLESAKGKVQRAKLESG